MQESASKLTEPKRDDSTQNAGEVLMRRNRAHDELSEAVQRQWGGEPAFRLSIPANRSRDTDLLIADSLNDIPDLVEKLAKAEKALRPFAEGYNACAAATADIPDDQALVVAAPRIAHPLQSDHVTMGDLRRAADYFRLPKT